MTTTTLPRNLDDTALLARLHALVGHERALTAELLANLAEVDTRRLYLGEGCASMFTYCTQVLHYSEHAAYERIAAARAARRFPALLALVGEGALHLAGVTLLAPHLTDENQAAVLAQARHQSKRAIEKLVAALQPRPDIADLVRRLPVKAAPAAPSAVAPLSGCPTTPGAACPSPTAEPLRLVPSAAPTPAVVAPLAPERYKVAFTASERVKAKLDRARALARHQLPGGELEAVMELALDALIEKLEKRREGATEAPRAAAAAPRPGSRHVPNAVRRAVYARDKGRCTFVSSQGRRCTEEGCLELHHLDAFALGGAATVENIALRCRAHNAYEGEALFGPAPRRKPAAELREAGAEYQLGPGRVGLSVSQAGAGWA